MTRFSYSGSILVYGQVLLQLLSEDTIMNARTDYMKVFCMVYAKH